MLFSRAVIVSSILCCLGLFGWFLGLASRWESPVEGYWFAFFKWAIVPGAVCGAICAENYFQCQTDPKYQTSAARVWNYIFSVPFFIGAFICSLNFLNARLSRSVPYPISAIVVEKSVTSKSGSRFLTVHSKKRGNTSFEVSTSTYKSLEIGDHVIVDICSGFLGVDWVKRAYKKPKNL